MAAPRRLIVMSLAVSLAIGACSDLVGDTTTVTRSTEPSATAAGSSPEPSSTETAAPQPNPPGESVTLLAVLDGDSLAVARNGQREEVRLVGINTPEADECHGDAARDAMTAHVDDADLVLTVVPSADDRDQFGRLLRDVWADGMWINEAQVTDGHAVALQGGAETEATLVLAERSAFESARGMWALDACGPQPSDVELSVRIGDIRYDPPGRDFESTEEEFISIVNEAATGVDMEEWILRDESSQHRFRFPAFVLGAGDAVRVRTGCGDDGGRDLFWCAGDAVWSNGGDTVILQNAAGTVIDRFKYEGDF